MKRVTGAKYVGFEKNISLGLETCRTPHQEVGNENTRDTRKKNRQA